MSFVSELKRRKVFQVAAVYLVVAWLIMQVVDVVNDPLSLPEWFDTVAILLLAIGFPITLMMSWAFDLTTKGVVRDEGDGVVLGGGRKVEYVLIGSLALAVAWLGYRVEINPSDQPADVTAREEDQRDVLPNSVAVLPFDNMSADPEDAYFAAGIHDEILNQLAKIQNLNVIARTSVIQYAGAARPITEIANELNVGTVMEGSVSYADGRVAVRAQLIDAETGVHLWSDSYNREFSDVFGIQADIAMNVANALEAEFSLAEQAQLEQIPTDSPVAYELYLRTLTTDETDRGQAYLDQAIALDPEFALAHALKAFNYAARLESAAAGPGEVVTLEPLARENAERALEIDPSVGMAHSALAILHTNAGNLVEAQTAYERAMELSPQDFLIRFVYTRFLRYIGRLDDALRLSQRSAELGPNDAFNYTQLGFSYWYLREYESAAAAFSRGIELAPGTPLFHLWLGFVEASRGHNEEALRELSVAEQLGGDGFAALRLAQTAFAYSQLGRREDAARYFEMLEERAQEQTVAESICAIAHLAIGDYEEAYRRLEIALNDPVGRDQIPLAELKANPFGSAVLDEPRWQALRDRIGVL